MNAVSKQEYGKLRKRYSYLVAVPLLLAIFHFIGQILLQYSLSLDKSDPTLYHDSFSSLGRIFSSSALPCLCLSPKYDLKRIYSVSAVVSIALGLILVFSSVYASRGKGRCLLLALCIEGADLALLLPCLILSLKGRYPLKMTLTDYILNLLFHLIGLAALIYSLPVIRKIHDYEVSQGEIKE